MVTSPSTATSSTIRRAFSGSASNSSLRLSGMHAVLTGAGGGIGVCIAHALAAEGAHLTLMGRRIGPLQALADALNGQYSIDPSVVDIETGQPSDATRLHGVAVVDVADEAAVHRAFDEARAARGPVSVLINNAGQAESAPFGKTSHQLWQRMLDVNLTGTFLCTQAALPDMLKRAHGRVVNVASTAGLKGYPYVAAYVAAKHGVVGLTRALALEVARKGVTVNAVCPGYTETELLRNSIALVIGKTGRSEAEAREEFTGSNPQGRIVQPEEVADAVLWLCSPSASSITGQSISVSGGEVT